jgi:hypothetical protein
MSSNIVDKVKIRLASGGYSEEPAYIGTTVDYVKYGAANQSLTELLSDFNDRLGELENSFNTEKGSNGLDGKNMYIVFSKDGTDANAVDTWSNDLGSTYYLGYALGYETPAEYNWIRMGGEQGDPGATGAKGDKGEKGDTGSSFTITGYLKLDNLTDIAKYIPSKEEDVAYLVEDGNEKKYVYIYTTDKEKGTKAWYNAGQLAGPSAYDIAKSQETTSASNEKNWILSLSAYGIALDLDKNLIKTLGGNEEDPYSNDNKKLWIASLKGESAYEIYKDTVPNTETALTKDEWLKSLKGKGISSVSVNKSTDKAKLNFAFDDNTSQDLEIFYNETSSLYLVNDNSYSSPSPSGSLKQVIHSSNTLSAPENNVYAYYSTAFGSGNIIGKEKNDSSDTDTTLTAFNFTAGQNNTIGNHVECAAVIGLGLQTSQSNQIVLGTYNVEDAAAALIVGVGTSSEKKNGLVVKKESGNVEISGDVTLNGVLTAPSITALVVNNDSELKGKLFVSKNTTLNDALTVSGNTTVGGTLSAGATTISSLVVSDIFEATSNNLTTYKNILPNKTNERDLGSSSLYWNNIYVNNLKVANLIKIPSLNITGNVYATDFYYSDGKELFSTSFSSTPHFGDNGSGHWSTFYFGNLKILYCITDTIDMDGTNTLTDSHKQWNDKSDILNIQVSAWKGKPNLTGDHNGPAFGFDFGGSDGDLRIWNDAASGKASVLVLIKR